MKKTLLIILFIAGCLQQVQSQHRIGLVGGGLYARSNLNAQNQSGVLFKSSTTFGNIYSFFGGIVYDIKITNEFSIKSKLLLVNKGWTETNHLKNYAVDTISALNIGAIIIPVESIKSKQTYKLSYLEIPVNFTFYTPVGKSLLSFGVGPYISFGISGKYDYKALNSSKHFSSNSINNDTLIFTLTNRGINTSSTTARLIPFIIPVVSITDTNNYVSSFTAPLRFEGSKNKDAIYTAYKIDYGAAIEASLEFRNGFSVTTSYTVGVANILKEHYGALQNRHRVIQVGLGYYMKKKRK